MRQLAKSGKRLLSLLLTLMLVAGFLPGGLLAPITAKAADIPDAPTREQASVIKFIDAKTNYLGGIALDAAGKVWTWGYNAEGMLGTNSASGAYSGGMMRLPFFVDNNINIIQIEGGYHTNYALDDKGILYAWGKGNEGQMGNGTTTANNPYPKVVSSLTDLNLKIKKIITTTEASSATYVLTDDGKVYAWGYADGYRINGWSGYQRQARHLPEFDGLNIVDIDLGNQHGIALDAAGQIYTWGYNNFGQLGYGNTTLSATPKKVEFFNGMQVVNISAESATSMAVTSDGRAWIWGTTYEATSSSPSSYLRSAGGPLYYWPLGRSRTVTSPVQIEFDMTSAPSDLNYGGTAPAVAFVTAGRYASYVTDIYGRVWYFGWNVNYGFCTDGPLFTTTNGGKHSVYTTKATLLKTLGDGDTQGYMNNPIAPVFSGFTSTSDFLAQYNSYNRFGQWSQMGDGLHPTIYDKKYMVTSNPSSPTLTNDYPLDKNGNRLVYVIRRESASPITYGGAFYIADAGYSGSWCVNNSSTTALPAGVTDVKSSPVVKEDERSWISLVVELDTFDYTGNQLNAMPYISGISTYQSQILFIDNVGNLYKQSLDGSGSIAWGWDYSKYENGTAGNNATSGLYNFYNYEIMYMRGAPNVAFAEVIFEKPVSKIYLVEDEFGNTPTDSVKVTVTVPAAVTDDKLNLTVEPELTELRYVYIPYDETDPNFNLVDFTADDFYTAANSGAYATGNLLNTAISYKEGTYSFDVGVTNNGKFWVLTKDLAYTRTQYHTAEYLIDNFYTPVEINHRGVEFEDPPGREVYAPTDDNVVKTSTDPAIVKPDGSYVGIPLDANGNVLTSPSLGYDSVRVNRYATLPGGLDSLWTWYTPQDEYADYTLNNLSYFVYESGVQVPFVHDFYYDFIGEADLDQNKTVADANADGYASPGEVLSYTITIVNNGTAPATDVPVQDTLSMLLPYIDAPSGDVTVDNDGTAYTVTFADLMGGFEIASIGAGTTTTVKFSVKVIADLDTENVTVLKNIAVVGGTEPPPPTEIETLGVKKNSSKEQFTGNGDTIEYSIRFKMPDDISKYDAVRIVDLVPPELLYENGSAKLIIDGFESSVAVVNNGDMQYYDLDGATFAGAAGKIVELKMTYTITGWESGSITNKAQLFFRLAGETDFPDEPNVEDEKTIDKEPLSDLEYDKSVADANGDGYASPGEVLTYTITIVNSGDASAYNTPVQDTLSELLPYIEAPSGDVTVNNNSVVSTVTFTQLMSGFGVLEIEEGATVTVTFSVKVIADLDTEEITVLTNTAVVGDIIPPPPTEIETLGVKKNSSKEQFTGNGDTIEYTIRFKMPSDITKYDAVRIVDLVPPELVYESDSAVLIIDGDETGVTMLGTATRLYYDLVGTDFAAAAGKIVELKLTFTITGWVSGPITNTAQLYFRPAGDTDFPDEPNVEDQKTITKELAGEIDYDKSVADANGDGYASPGEVLTYTITIVNIGDASAYDVSVQDTLSELLPYIDAPSGSVTVDNDSTVYTVTFAQLMSGFDIPEIEEGATVTVTFIVKVIADLDTEEVVVLTNTAVVGGKEPPPPTEIETLGVKKDSSKEQFTGSGDTIEYTIRFKMPDDVSKYDAVRIVDLVPETLVYEDDSAVLIIDGTATPVTMEGTATRLYYDLVNPEFAAAAGKIVQLKLTFTVTGWESGSITNKAQLYFRPAGDTDFPDEPNVEDQKTITKELASELDYDKSVADANGDGYASPGEVLTYTITIVNNGDAPAYNTPVQDTLSDLLPYIEAPSGDVTVNNDGFVSTVTFTQLMAGFGIMIIEEGATVTVTFSVKVLADLDTEEIVALTNTATVGDVTPPPPTEIETLGVKKSTDKEQFIGNGDTIEYTIRFKMPDDISKYDAVRIVDLIPTTLVYESGSAKLYIDGAENSVTMLGNATRLYYDLEYGDFAAAAGKIVELKLTFTITGWTGGEITNKAQLFFRPAGDSDFPDEPNVEDQKTIDKKPASELDTDKAVADASGDGYASPGEVLTYTLTIANNGDASAMEVLVQDTLSEILAHIEAPFTSALTINGVTIGAMTVADLIAGFEIPEVGAGVTVTIVFSVTVKDDLDTETVKELRNQATLGPDDPPPPVIIKTKSALKIAKLVNGMPILTWAANEYDGDLEDLLADISFMLYKVSGNGATITGSPVATGTISPVDGFIRFTPSTFDEGWYAVVEVLTGVAVDVFEVAAPMYIYVQESGNAAGGGGNSFDYSSKYNVTYVFNPYHTLGVTGLNGGGEVFRINAVAEDGTTYISFCAHAGSYAFGDHGYLTATPLAGADDVLDALNYINNKYGSIDYWAWNGWPAASDPIQTRLISQIVVWVLYNGIDINAFYNGGMTAFGLHDFSQIPQYRAAIDDVLANYKGTTGEITALAYLLCAEDPVNHNYSCQPQLVPIFGDNGGFNNTTLSLPALESIKTVADANEDGYASPGEVLTYTITIKNVGGSAAVDTYVQDGMDALLPYIIAPSGSVTIINDGATSTRPIADLIEGFEIASIGAGKTVTVTFTVTVRADLDMEEIVQLENAAIVGPDNPPVIIETLGVKKISNKVLFTGNGDTVDYAISFKMPDDISDYEAVKIVDVIPATLAYVDDSASLKIGDGAAAAVAMSFDADGNLYYELTGAAFTGAAGKIVVLTLTFEITDWTSGPIINKGQLYFKPVDGDYPDDPNVEDTLTIDKLPMSDLDSDKTVADANNDGYASPGEVLTYTITIVNNGDAAATDVPVQDTLEDLLDYIDAPSGNVAINNGGVTSTVTFADLMDGFTIDVIAAGATVTVKFSVTVIAELDTEEVITLTNTAIVGDYTPPPPVIETLGVKKDSNKDQFAGNGDTVVYTISFRMPTDISDYEAIKIVDVVPDTLVYEDGSARLFIGGVEINSVAMLTDADGNLYYEMTGSEFADAAGKIVSMTLTFTVSGWTSGPITNEAQLYLKPVDGDYPDDPNDKDDTTITKLPMSDLDSDKTVADENNDGYASPGEVLSYTITIKNVGDAAATDVPVQDTLEDLLPYIDAPSGNVTVSNGSVVSTVTFAELMDGFTIDEIAAGATVTVKFSVTVIADLDTEEVIALTNTAIVGEYTPPPPVIETLGVKKNSSKDQFTGNGDTLDYTISFRMPTDISDYEAIKIVDVVPGTLAYVDGSASLKIGDGTAAAVTMSLDTDGNLYYELAGAAFTGAAGQVVKLTLSFTITGWTSGPITNTAQLYLKPVDGDYPDDPNDEDTTTITKQPLSDLIADKSVIDGNYDGYASPGEYLHYTITIKNVGDAAASGVFVIDALSDILDYLVDPSANEVTITGADADDDITVADLMTGFEIAEIEAGATVTVCFSVQVLEELDTQEVIVLKNAVIVNEQTPPPVEIETLGVRKNSNKAQFTGNGDTVVYTISFRMPTDISDYEAIKIVDIVPATLVYEEGSAKLFIGGVEISSVDMDTDADGNLFYEMVDAEFADAAGKIVSLTLTFTVSGWTSGPIINTAQLYLKPVGEDYPPDPNDEDEETITKLLAPYLVNVKSVEDENDDGYASPGETLKYKISVTNNGDAAAVSVKVQDELEDLLPNIDNPMASAVVITGASITGMTIADLIDGITITSIAPGVTVTFEFSVKVKESLDVSVVKELKNQATVSQGTPPPPVIIETRNLLTLVKTVDGMILAKWAEYFEGDIEEVLKGVTFELYAVDDTDSPITGTPVATGTVSAVDGVITFDPPTVPDGWYALVEKLSGTAVNVFIPADVLFIYVTSEGVMSTVSKPNVDGTYEILYTNGYTWDIKLIYEDGTVFNGGTKPDGSNQRLSTERFDALMPDGNIFPSFCADLGAHQVWGDYAFDLNNHNFKDEDLTYLVALLDYLNDQFADQGGIEGIPGRMLAQIIIWNMILRIDGSAGYADTWHPESKLIKIEGATGPSVYPANWYTQEYSDLVDYILDNVDEIYGIYNAKLAAGPDEKYVSGAIYIVGTGHDPVRGNLAPIDQQRQIVVLYSDEMVFKNVSKVSKLNIRVEVDAEDDYSDATFKVEVTGPNGYKKIWVVPADDSITIFNLPEGTYNVKMIEDGWATEYHVNGGAALYTDSVNAPVEAGKITYVRIILNIAI